MSMYGRNNANKIFSIPVEWVVTETLQIKADSLEEAIEFINNNADEIPLGDEPAYIDGTYKISADEDYDMDTQKIKRNLEAYGYSEREAQPFDLVDKEIGGVA